MSLFSSYEFILHIHFKIINQIVTNTFVLLY